MLLALVMSILPEEKCMHITYLNTHTKIEKNCDESSTQSQVHAYSRIGKVLNVGAKGR